MVNQRTKWAFASLQEQKVQANIITFNSLMRASAKVFFPGPQQ
jgi:hypothetical protein